MGLFFMEDNTTEESKKEYAKQVSDYAKECREKTKNVDNSNFPDYLWNASVNKFENDNYLVLGLCTDEEVHKVYQLGVKYSNINDYYDAMAIYDNYMEYLADLYGGFDNLNLMVKITSNDTLYIPRMPRLTHKKQFRKFLKYGIAPARINEEAVVDDSMMRTLLDGIEAGTFAEPGEVPKWIRKMHEETLDRKSAEDRVKNIWSNNSSSEGVDAIINFITTGGTDTNTTSKYTSLYDEIEEMHQWDYYPQAYIDAMNKQETIFMENGRWTKTSDKDEIYKELLKNGHMFVKGENVGASNDAIRAASKQYSLEPENLTKKQLKKLKKKQYEEKKAKIRRQVTDTRTQKLLGDTKLDLSDTDLSDFNLSSMLRAFGDNLY